jgi:hypothetical protein
LTVAKSRNRRRKLAASRSVKTVMAKTDTRKASLQNQTPENKQQTKEQPARSFLGWLRENYPKLAKLGGLVTGAPSVFAFYHSTIPSIHPTAGSSPADPFSLQFVIRNDNPILTMDKIAIKCIGDRVIYENNQVISNSTAQVSTGSDQIPPKGQSNYFCAIPRQFVILRDNGIPATAFYAAISLVIEYKTPIFRLDWSRGPFPVGPFIWRAGVAGNQWMEGPEIK